MNAFLNWQPHRVDGAWCTALVAIAAWQEQTSAALCVVSRNCCLSFINASFVPGALLWLCGPWLHMERGFESDGY
jgi:hypothetical protein